MAIAKIPTIHLKTKEIVCKKMKTNIATTLVKHFDWRNFSTIIQVSYLVNWLFWMLVIGHK